MSTGTGTGTGPSAPGPRLAAAGAAAARMLVLWCPDWAVTAMRRRPEETVAVTAGERVVAVSATARTAGVRPGQRRREAEAYCPGLSVVRSDPGAEARAFEPVVVALETFGVPVAVGRPGWAALGTRGPARRLGGEESFARAVGAVVAGALAIPDAGTAGAGPDAGPLAGRCWSVGVADGPFAATVVARRGGGLVPPGASGSFLAPLAIEEVGEPELADLLRRLGLTTLGAFAAIAEREVLARFGPEGARAHRLASGREQRLLTGRRVPPDLSVEHRLDPPETRVDAAAFVAKEIAERLGGHLAARGLACTLLRVEVATAEGGHLERLWADDGSWSPGLVAERLRWQLEAWLLRGGAGGGAAGIPLDHGIELVRLVPVEVVPDRGRQLELWGRSAEPIERAERAARAFARVQGLVGVQGVLRAVRQGGRGPVEQVRLVAVGDPLPPDLTAGPPGTRTRAGNPDGSSRPASRGASGAERSAPWPGRLPAPSPAVVPAEPVPAELLDSRGRDLTVDGRGQASTAPVALDVAGAGPVPVAAWAGPWPVDERWWDRRSYRRRARLQVLTAAGEAYLLVLDGGRWSVEGSYD